MIQTKLHLVIWEKMQSDKKYGGNNIIQNKLDFMLFSQDTFLITVG